MAKAKTNQTETAETVSTTPEATTTAAPVEPVVEAPKKEPTMKEQMIARVEEGLKTVAPKAIQLAIAFGQFHPDGTYLLKHETIAIDYNPLLDTVLISQGVSPVFAANVGLERVTAFRKGTWEQVFNRLYSDRYQDQNVAEVAEKNIYKLAVNLGLLK